MRNDQQVRRRLRSEFVIVLLLAMAALARTSTAQTAPPKASATEEAESHQSSGKGDGIKVHGHWTIDVREPDGKLAAHHEFENALLPNGTALLSDLLGLKVAVRNWTVYLFGSSQSSQPCAFPGLSGPRGCALVEPNHPLPAGAEEFNTLTLTVLPQFGQGASLQLTGDFTASFDGDIARVMTSVLRVSPSTGFIGYDFSQRVLGAAAIPVAAGQHVYVQVTFTFS